MSRHKIVKPPLYPKKLEAISRNRGNIGFLTGFTLIELLVVISIITILVGIMIPAMQKVKEQTRAIICRNNLHQYGISADMYLNNYDFKFSLTFTWLYKDRGGVHRWHDRLNNLDNRPELAGCFWPYLKHMDIHCCPSFKLEALKRPCPNGGCSIPMEPQYSYGQNANLGGDAGNYGEVWAIKSTQVKNPATCFLYSEENCWVIPTLCTAALNDNNLRISSHGNADCFATYHNPPGGNKNYGSANAVFVDLHTEVIHREQQDNLGYLDFSAVKK